MLDKPKPSDFFHLDDVSFKEIFETCEFPWEALSRLQYFMHKMHREIQCEIPPSVTLVNEESIIIGEGTVIQPHAYIEGPCKIGKNCTIRHGACIRAYTLIDDDCLVGHASEIKHAILLRGAKAPHFNYVGDSILGKDVNLGAGVVCANLRCDDRDVVVYFEGKRYPTGLRKLGAIIGDGVRLGSNSVTNPGTIIRPHVICGACLNLKGFISNAVVFETK